ncbi:hypothetical protein B0H17DRAFT_1148866 [Mycena rosella]|uniref:Uncharacterized protein n=1 Tax=Mycena rosella TaxID=1033263 RepID=A0AAD7C6W5_MYCRO|nr:hypothetical protein B0H17DRAFT_1148866 [Mycena rosella]
MLLGLSALIITFLVWLALSTRICRVIYDCLCGAERLDHRSQGFSARPRIQKSPNHCTSKIGDILAYYFRLQPPLMHSLQWTVSEIQERQLRNSLRPWCKIWNLLRGHSLRIFRCIQDMTVLKNQIEVCFTSLTFTNANYAQIRREIRLRELLEVAVTNAGDATRLRLKHLDMRHTRLPIGEALQIATQSPSWSMEKRGKSQGFEWTGGGSILLRIISRVRVEYCRG